MKITYLVRTDGACDFYRVEQPLKQLGKSTKGVNQIYEMTQASFMSACERDDSVVLSKLMSSDIIVIPRLWGVSMLRNIKLVAPQAKIVLEYDDNLFDVSPFSPHYADHGWDEFEFQVPGSKEILKVWEDGKNIDLKYNRLKTAETIDAMKEADMLTVTTKRLQKIYEVYNPNVAVLPNCVDLSLWNKLPLLPHKGIRLGWFGGSSHYEDWCVVAGILPEVMALNPEVTLVLMGHKFEGTLKGIPENRIEFHPWVKTAGYHYKAAILDLDLAIIPLKESRFNACKSPIKYLEMSALKVPSVCSFVPPYSDVATEENGFWIDENLPEAWKTGLNLAIRNPDLRKQVGLFARKTVEDYFDSSKTWPLWENAYKGVLNGRTDTSRLNVVSS